ANANGGAVDINAGSTPGAVSITGLIDTRGGTAGLGQGGKAGGAVTIDGLTISVNAINTSGSATEATGDANGGNAGLVTLNTTAGGNIAPRGDLTAPGGAAVGTNRNGGSGGAATFQDRVLLDAAVGTVDTPPGVDT